MSLSKAINKTITQVIPTMAAATPIDLHPKFLAGVEARLVWKKSFTEETFTINRLNELTGNVFDNSVQIILDTSPRRQTTLIISAEDMRKWNQKDENIYVITRNDRVMKIGGTRTGMAARFGSYICGYCVPQRIKKRTGMPFPGKMSVTNAHLYHTIENDLINNPSIIWKFYFWKLPVTKVSVEIFGQLTEVVCQTYHAYESRCMELFKRETGHIPQLCNNSDPGYRS
jgi:hypothetical protein